MNETVSSRASALPRADWIARPAGASFGSHGGGTTVTGFATATRVTFAVVPLTLNSHIGTVAGPRDVCAGPVVSRAAVMSRGLQPEQGAPPDLTIAASAWSAESRSNAVDVPSTHRT